MNEKKKGEKQGISAKNMLTRKQRLYRRIGYMLLAAVLISLDVLSKQWALAVLEPVGTIPLLDGIIGLRFARNFGAAFSSFSGATTLLSVFSLCVCVGVAWYLMRNIQMQPMEGTALTMVFAGGIGNLIDRVTRGYVVDYFEFQFMEFAIFNLADVLITTGAVLLFIALMRGGNEG